MVRFFLFIAVILSSGCSKHFDDLILSRIDYVSGEIRTDGYYFSDVNATNNIGVAIFYTDGVIFHIFFGPSSDFTLDKIENEFLLSQDFFADLVKDRPNLGVFRVSNENIEFEVWDFGGEGVTTYTHYGEILNDTTFMIHERVNNSNKTTVTENLTYRFKQFSPKPDSTNTFIK